MEILKEQLPGIDFCPYCGSEDIEDVMDYQVPPDYPYDLIKCNACFNRWEVEPSAQPPPINDNNETSVLK